VPQINFENQMISKLRLPANKKIDIFTDSRHAGLQLRLRWKAKVVRSKKSTLEDFVIDWLFRYQIPHTQPVKRSQLKIGDWPEMSPSAAVAEAKKLMDAVHAGTDPRALVLRKRAEEIDTASVINLGVVLPKFRFENILEQMSQYWPSTGKSLETFEKYQRSLEIHALPKFRGRDIRSISGNEWDELITKTANIDKKPGAANNIHKAGRRLFNFAVEQEIIQYNPILQRKRSLTATRLAPSDQFLDAAQVHKFLSELYEQDIPAWAKVNLDLMLRVGVRIEEWKRIKIGWVNLKSMRIEHPGSSMKNGRDALTHLPEPAIKILINWLRDLKTQHGALKESWYLFPDETDPTKPNSKRLSDITSKLKSWVNFTPKQLRKTISTHLQRQGCPPVVLRAIRNQTVAEGVEVHYDFDDLFHLKKLWLEKWSELLEEAKVSASALVTDRDSHLESDLLREVDDLFS
jgi:site-specific recombinase XerD